MKTTIELLEKALKQHPAPYWTQKLNLARTTLATARVREHLSPAIAGALAEEMGEDAQKWMVIAALESERDSACKSRMVRKFLMGNALGAGSVYYVKSQDIPKKIALIARLIRLRDAYTAIFA